MDRIVLVQRFCLRPTVWLGSGMNAGYNCQVVLLAGEKGSLHDSHHSQSNGRKHISMC